MPSRGTDFAAEEKEEQAEEGRRRRRKRGKIGKAGRALRLNEQEVLGSDPVQIDLQLARIISCEIVLEI